jgi:hypothetical protein
MVLKISLTFEKLFKLLPGLLQMSSCTGIKSDYEQEHLHFTKYFKIRLQLLF